MRVLVVSAHFPPNFVSGGTIAPQRQARGLRSRGHDVSVYAGWLGEERPPLSTWEDVDEIGLPVRWIAITPWTGWHDEHNFDHAAVTADFRRHLAETAPDVVHLHSLQALGAPLVEAAADAGIPTVVTMHDFWWICARQFLVTREFQPCSLVVEAGVCACEVDRPWLEQRNARLAAALSRADLVLTPSAAAAGVLRANGVDPARLRVDENGLPPAPPPPRRPPRGDTLRLLYTGGFNRMKGVHVLLDAAQRLAERPGWSLTAYDIGPHLEETGFDLSSLPVDARPAFRPDETTAVMQAADVLVLPSVMRESHSIVTREALQHGLPVITTDTLGPEEVVDDGRNGIVVPAGDAVALAGAIARLLDDPALLQRLREGARTPVAIRTLDDQVQHLDRMLQDLVDDARGRPSHPSSRAAAPARRIRRVVFVCGIEGAPLRYRARLPAEALGLAGVSTDVLHYRDPTWEQRALEADAVVVYRVPATRQVLDAIRNVRARGVPMVFDVDDLIFDPDVAAEIPALSILPEPEAELWMQGVRRYRTTMEACDAFVGSTAALCRHATQVTGLPSERFANGVGVLLGRMSDAATLRPRAPGPLRLGYFSGTDTHDHDWRSVETAVLDAVGGHRDAQLWLGGHVPHSPALDALGSRVRRLPMVPWTELPGLLRDLDVNLAPLELGSRFNEAKSAIKWLEAALVATPTIASPTEPFRDAIEPAASGVLATTPEEWHTAIATLLTDEVERRRLGARARREALLRWSPHLQGRRYLALLERVAARPRVVRPSNWVPVALDEPPMPVTLEPYGASIPATASPAGGHRGVTRSRLGTVARRAVRAARARR